MDRSLRINIAQALQLQLTWRQASNEWPFSMTFQGWEWLAKFHRYFTKTNSIEISRRRGLRCNKHLKRSRNLRVYSVCHCRISIGHNWGTIKNHWTLEIKENRSFQNKAPQSERTRATSHNRCLRIQHTVKGLVDCKKVSNQGMLPGSPTNCRKKRPKFLSCQPNAASSSSKPKRPFNNSRPTNKSSLMHKIATKS